MKGGWEEFSKTILLIIPPQFINESNTILLENSFISNWKFKQIHKNNTDTIFNLEIDRLNNVSESFASIDIVCDERKFIEINAFRTL